MDIKNLMKKAIEFHGHSCPGLAIGVVASRFILDERSNFSIDEELVAVVENDDCSVDAIQSLMGTSFGKGNLIFKDYGKNCFTFFDRLDGRAVRLSLKNLDFNGKNLSDKEVIDVLLNSSPENIFEIKEIEFVPPAHAKILQSVICYNCGESAMITRIHEHDNEKLCIPCYTVLALK